MAFRIFSDESAYDCKSFHLFASHTTQLDDETVILKEKNEKSKNLIKQLQIWAHTVYEKGFKFLDHTIQNANFLSSRSDLT